MNRYRERNARRRPARIKVAKGVDRYIRLLRHPLRSHRDFASQMAAWTNAGGNIPVMLAIERPRH